MISEIEELDEASRLYKKTLEDKLIKKFKEDFNEKIGYIPQVITWYDNDNELPRITLKQLIDVINQIMSEEYGRRKIGKKLLRITSLLRAREVVEYRHIYYKIGSILGYRPIEIGDNLVSDKGTSYDRTTVMHGVKAFDCLLSTSRDFALKYEKVVKRIKERYEKSN